MKKVLFALLLLGCGTFGAAPETQPSLWGSDGCSSSPDLQKAVVCCDGHDYHFRAGGPLGTWTQKQFLASNRYFAACLTQFELPEVLVRGYFEMVNGPLGRAVWEEHKRENQRTREPEAVSEGQLDLDL